MSTSQILDSPPQPHHHHLNQVEHQNDNVILRLRGGSYGGRGDETLGTLEGDEMEGDAVEGEEEEEEYLEGEGEMEGFEEGSQSTSSSVTWITWFCTMPGHEYFCEIAEDFIEDDFNLTGLNILVPFYKEALEMILDVEPEEESLKIPDVSILESSAELLYGLIHQRFIVTRQGLLAMHEKYQSGHFGLCPRVYCNGFKVVPCGRSDLPGVDTVKLYCSNCVDTYTPPSSRFNAVDGAFFGTTFPHMFFQTYRELMPPIVGGYGAKNSSASSGQGQGQNQGGKEEEPTTVMTSSAKIYQPKIYGFRVSERAKSGPRMQWLRMRPRKEEELDNVDEIGNWRPGYGTNKNVKIVLEDEEEEEEEEERQGKTGSKGTTVPVSTTGENGARKRK